MPTKASAEQPGRDEKSEKGTFLSRLGPGLVTGASDDDPSGIATYSQAGAAYGFGLLWTLLFSLPLMASIQELSGRVGRVTGRGIAGNIRRSYSGWLLYPIVALLVAANTINLGADIGAMGDALALVIGGRPLLYAAAFAVGSMLLEVFVQYDRYRNYLKWLTLVLLSYVATVFLIHVPWAQAMKGTFVPSIRWTSDYWETFIAILGTTISPYLFFWQASQETEEIKSDPEAKPLKAAPVQARRELGRIHLDTVVGMTLSNIIAFFIVLAAGATLHLAGKTQVNTSAEAAAALQPLAGRMTAIIFSLGIVGTGLMAVPVLAGSAAYAVGEALKWPCGLARKPLNARGFYCTLSAATLMGLAINFPIVQRHIGLTPIRALFWSAVINGVAAVPIMVVLMRMVRNPGVMGKFSTPSRWLYLFGWVATAVMALAAGGMLISLVH